MPAKRDLKNMVGGASEGIRRGAGLNGMIGTPSENTEVEAVPLPAPVVELENLSTRLRKGQRKQLHRLAVELERDAQELVQEALDLLFEKYKDT